MDFWLFWPKFLKRTHFRAESRPIWNWNPPGGYGKEGQDAAVFLMARDIKKPLFLSEEGEMLFTFCTCEMNYSSAKYLMVRTI